MMRSKHLAGTGAGVDKYDLLTALSVAGLSHGGALQTSAFRLLALVTARYNWATDELSMGHREMAALWSVDERTAKRETKRLIDAGLIALKRKGARGRVSSYRLCISQIFTLSEPIWERIGPDFQERMAERQAPRPQEAKVVKLEFKPRPRSEDALWEQVLDQLGSVNPARVQAWYARLTPVSFSDGTLLLHAASAFALQYIQTHLLPELTAAARDAYPGLKRLQFENSH